MSDVRDFVPHRMRFTKGLSHPICFKLDHEWEPFGTVKVAFRINEYFPSFKCKRCGKCGWLMDNIYWEQDNN
jgi:hypothetical protein